MRAYGSEPQCTPAGTRAATACHTCSCIHPRRPTDAVPVVPFLRATRSLTSGNRAELLVRCINPGNYVLTAGRAPSMMGTWVNTDVNNLVQPVVMHIQVTARSRWERHASYETSWPLKERVCTPLYPGYAAPLTDANIAKANAQSKVILQPAGFTRNAPGVVGNIVSGGGGGGGGFEGGARLGAGGSCACIQAARSPASSLPLHALPSPSLPLQPFSCSVNGRYIAILLILHVEQPCMGCASDARRRAAHDCCRRAPDSGTWASLASLY